MLANALLNELFNEFPILFHVKVCVGAMLSFQKRKRVLVLIIFKSAHLIITENYIVWCLNPMAFLMDPTI